MLLIHKLGHRFTQVSSFFSMSIVIVRDSLPYVITERKQNVWLSLFQFQIKAADKQWRWYIVYQTAPLPITRMTIKIISAVANSSILTRRSAAEWPPRYTAQSLCRIVSLNAESCRIDYEPYTIYRLTTLSMTLSDLWPRFQGHDIIRHRISQKRHEIEP